MYMLHCQWKAELLFLVLIEIYNIQIYIDIYSLIFIRTLANVQKKYIFMKKNIFILAISYALSH